MGKPGLISGASCSRQELRPRPTAGQCAEWDWSPAKPSPQAQGSMQKGGEKLLRARGEGWLRKQCLQTQQDWCTYESTYMAACTKPTQAYARRARRQGSYQEAICNWYLLRKYSFLYRSVTGYVNHTYLRVVSHHKTISTVFLCPFINKQGSLWQNFVLIGLLFVLIFISVGGFRKKTFVSCFFLFVCLF